MTKNEIKIYIVTLNDNITYTNFRTELSNKLRPMVYPKEYYYKWYGIFKNLKRENND